jgi:uncharacterized repeat protein (TIGR03803 family)
VLTTLISFSGTNGEYPETPLTLGCDGNFYGTTEATFFQFTTNGTLTTLISFPGGWNPNALTLGSDGNFYGTTYGDYNGMTYTNEGTIFKVTTNGTMTTLVSFEGTNGAYPYGALTPGSDGNFYGTTEKGGITNAVFFDGFGTIFRVTTNGTLTTLVSFNGTTGAIPVAGLTLASDGCFYGTTANGGSNSDGTVFRLSLSPVVSPPLPVLTLQFWAGYPLLTLYGTLGDTYTIQYSTNLAVPNWTPMLIVPNLSISPYQMIDPAGIGEPARFYRVVMQ